MKITTSVGLSLDQPVFPGPIQVTKYDPVQEATGLVRPEEPIRVGDVLTTVDGQDLRALPLDLVQRFIEKPTAHGASRDKVDLTLRRDEEMFITTLPRPPPEKNSRSRTPRPYTGESPREQRSVHDSFSSSYSRSSVPMPEVIRAEVQPPVRAQAQPQRQTIQHLSPTTIELRHETLAQQRTPDYVPAGEINRSAILTRLSQPSGMAGTQGATPQLAQTDQRVHVTRIETSSQAGRISGSFGQTSPESSSLGEGRMLRSRIIPRREWATHDVNDEPDVDALRASGTSFDQRPPPRWAEDVKIAPAPQNLVRVSTQHLSPGNRLTPASAVESAGVGTTFLDATGTAYVEATQPRQSSPMTSSNNVWMGQGWYTSEGFTLGDKDTEKGKAIGFLLDQKVSGGDIVIEDIGEEGMASKMLRHPAISVQKGDILVEVDGQEVAGMTCKEVADLIRDPWEETPNATIVVYRPSSKSNVTVVLPRPPRTRDLDNRRKEAIVTPRSPRRAQVRRPEPNFEESESGLPWDAPRRREVEEAERQQMLAQRSSARSISEEEQRLKATNEALVERELERRRISAQKSRKENEHKQTLKMLKDLETCYSNIGVAIRREEFEVAYQWLNMAGALSHKAGVHGSEARLSAARELIVQAQRDNEDSQLVVEQIGPNWSVARAKQQPGPQDSANSFKFYPPAFSPREITGQTILEEEHYYRPPESSYEPPPFRPPSPIRTDLLLETVIAKEDEDSLKEAMSIQRELLVLDALERTLAEAAKEELERKSEAVMKLYIVDSETPTPAPAPPSPRRSPPTYSPPVLQASFTDYPPPPPKDTTKPFTEEALDKEKMRLMERVLSASFDDDDDDDATPGRGASARKEADGPDVFRYAGV